MILCGLLSSHYVGAITFEEFQESDKSVAGTPGRQETEFKLPMVVDKDLSTSHLTEEIYKALSALVKGETLSFPKLTKNSYYLDERFKAFAFKDYYFDDEQNTVLNLKSAYRLRYRWSHKQAYLRHRLFPFVKAFDPSRCEIQFKYGYKNLGDGIISVRETRFEFRNQSDPFIENQDAPAGPWPVEEYTKYATSGVYKKWRTLPMDALINAMESNELDRGSINLQEQFELITFRDRMHINMKHPWGSSVNPEQTFIITLDHSTILHSRTPLKAEYADKMLLEVEVEIERNSSTEIDRIIENSIATDPAITHIVTQAVATSELAKVYLNKDLSLIRMAIIDVFKKHQDIAILPSNYKYARFRSWLEP